MTERHILSSLLVIIDEGVMEWVGWEWVEWVWWFCNVSHSRDSHFYHNTKIIQRWRERHSQRDGFNSSIM